FSPIPVIGVIAWPLVIVGLILSAIGFVRSRKGAPNKGLSIAGMTCSIIGLVLCIVWAAAFTEAANELEKAASGKVETSETSSGNSADGGSAAGVNDTVGDGKFEFTVTKVEKGLDHVGSGIGRSEPDGQYVIVHVTVNNTGNESQMLSMSEQKLFDDQGRTFTAATGEAAMALQDSEAFLNQINPGNSVKAQLLFDVPADADLAGIELHDSAFSGGVKVSFD